MSDMRGTFDTLTVAEELEKSGFAPAQAKALTRAIEFARAVDLSHLTTKQDLQPLKQDIAGLRQDFDILRRDVDTLRSKDLPTAIELLRRDLTIKVGQMMIAAVGVLIAAMGAFKYLPPH